MLMMHGRRGYTVYTLVGVHIDNQFSSFLPLRGERKINLSEEPRQCCIFFFSLLLLTFRK